MKIAIPAALFTVVVFSVILEIPRMISRPSEGLLSNIISSDYVWEPLRRARIGLYLFAGAGPDDVPYAGNSIIESAVIYGDRYFIEKYASDASEAKLRAGMELACDSADVDMIGALQLVLRARGIPFHCGEEVQSGD